MCESRLSAAPSGGRAKFTQPGLHFFLHACTRTRILRQREREGKKGDRKEMKRKEWQFSAVADWSGWARPSLGLSSRAPWPPSTAAAACLPDAAATIMTPAVNYEYYPAQEINCDRGRAGDVVRIRRLYLRRTLATTPFIQNSTAPPANRIHATVHVHGSSLNT